MFMFVFWIVRSCRLTGRYLYFRGTYCLYFKYVPPKCWYILTSIHSFTTQEAKISIFTCPRTNTSLMIIIKLGSFYFFSHKCRKVWSSTYGRPGKCGYRGTNQIKCQGITVSFILYFSHQGQISNELTVLLLILLLRVDSLSFLRICNRYKNGMQNSNSLRISFEVILVMIMIAHHYFISNSQ